MLNETSRLVRSQPIEARQMALIVIDVQNWVFDEQAHVENAYFQHRLHDLVLPNLRRLIRAARETGTEVMYTVIENLTRDGRDRSLDYKISGIFVQGLVGSQGRRCGCSGGRRHRAGED